MLISAIHRITITFFKFVKKVQLQLYLVSTTTNSFFLTYFIAISNPVSQMPLFFSKKSEKVSGLIEKSRLSHAHTHTYAFLRVKVALIRQPLNPYLSFREIRLRNLLHRARMCVHCGSLRRCTILRSCVATSVFQQPSGESQNSRCAAFCKKNVLHG